MPLLIVACNQRRPLSRTSWSIALVWLQPQAAEYSRRQTRTHTAPSWMRSCVKLHCTKMQSRASDTSSDHGRKRLKILGQFHRQPNHGAFLACMRMAYH